MSGRQLKKNLSMAMFILNQVVKDVVMKIVTAKNQPMKVVDVNNQEAISIILSYMYSFLIQVTVLLFPAEIQNPDFN